MEAPDERFNWFHRRVPVVWLWPASGAAASAAAWAGPAAWAAGVAVIRRLVLGVAPWWVLAGVGIVLIGLDPGVWVWPIARWW